MTPGGSLGAAVGIALGVVSVFAWGFWALPLVVAFTVGGAWLGERL